MHPAALMRISGFEIIYFRNPSAAMDTGFIADFLCPDQDTFFSAVSQYQQLTPEIG